MDLTHLQWKNRLLFLFAPDGSHPLFEGMRNEILAHQTAVKDRDLVIFEVLERGPSQMDQNQLDHETVEAIHKRFSVPRNRFTLILVGKDGATKLKRNEQTDLEEIFALIDSMPMRQDELRQKNQR